MTTALVAHEQVQITETGWAPTTTLSYEEWRDAGQQLLRVGRAWQWWVGDWVLYGERSFGERYAEAIELTGMEYSTIANVISVARKVEASRRREALSWTHHAEVAALPPAKQDEWLSRAEDEGLSHRRLRAALRDAMPAKKPAPDPEPQVEYVGQITVRFLAADDEDAHDRVKALGQALEQRGGTVTHKNVRAA